jgi:retinol dehydrogenase-12
MCRHVFVKLDILPKISLITFAKTYSSHSDCKKLKTMGKFITIASSIVVVIAVIIPIILSELIGGWTKKFTSPVYFRPSHIPNLTDKIAIVTGGNTGIGYQTALELARAGANVIVAARSEAKGIDAVERIQAEVSDAKVQFLPMDLSSLDSVSKFAKLFLKLNLPLHMLILNAGVMKSPGEMYVGRALNYGFETTQDGFEYHIGVNHIAHAHLTNLLLPKLHDSAPSRIISVSSGAEQSAPESGMKFQDWWVPKDGIMPIDYEDGKGYGQSKLANLMYTRELAKQLNGTNISAYSLHPGVILTELSRYMAPVMEEDARKEGVIASTLFKFFGKVFEMSNFDAKGGALTQLHLATADEADLVNGGFYHPVGKKVDPLHPQGLNETLSSILWKETQRAISKKSKYKFSG